MELPSSAYTPVKGRSTPILSSLPGEALGDALGVTAAGPHAASAAAELAMRNWRRVSRYVYPRFSASVFFANPPIAPPRALVRARQVWLRSGPPVEEGPE